MKTFQFNFSVDLLAQNVYLMFMECFYEILWLNGFGLFLYYLLIVSHGSGNIQNAMQNNIN